MLWGLETTISNKWKSHTEVLKETPGRLRLSCCPFCLIYDCQSLQYDPEWFRTSHLLLAHYAQNHRAVNASTVTDTHGVASVAVGHSSVIQSGPSVDNPNSASSSNHHLRLRSCDLHFCKDKY